MRTYLVRAKGEVYYVAEVQAWSSEEAVEHARKEHNVLEWYEEGLEDESISGLTDYESIRQDETTIDFD